MDWWIGTCGIAGVISALTLDYLGRTRGGEPWLSEQWPKRLVFVTAAGAFLGLSFGILPIQLYQVGRALIELSSTPPLLLMQALLPFLPAVAGMSFGLWLSGIAHRAWNRAHEQREGGMTGRSVRSAAFATWSWVLVILSIGGGFVTSFLLIRSL